MSVSFALDHVQLAAPPGSEEAARTFFCEILGWPEIDKPRALLGRGGVWFTSGAQEVHIGIEEDFVPARKAHPGFAVVGLSSLSDRLEGRGIQVIWDERRAAEGIARFYVHDPFGNRLEFMERLASPPQA